MDRIRTTTNKPQLTITSWLIAAHQTLEQVGISSARLDCLLLLEHTLKKSREWILAHGEHVPTKTQLEQVNKYVLQRKARIPLAYIIGSKEFYGRKFIVNKDVLIPRPESEAIIELLREVIHSWDSLVVDRASNKDHDSRITIHDLGTGSGCLAITAKLEFPKISVVATDNSKKALRVARKNASLLGASINFQIADLLSPTPSPLPTIILANLPYVPDGLITSEEITKEPAEALFSGKDGLDHYRTFWNQISNLEQKPAFIITESLKNQHQQMVTLAQQSGYVLQTTEGLVQMFENTKS